MGCRQNLTVIQRSRVAGIVALSGGTFACSAGVIEGVVISEASAAPLAEQPVEMVERKGIGHPDTICDAIAEQISVALAGAYTQACGRILHYNIDKALLVAGRVECRFGGGRVVEPMRLIIGDRATSVAEGRKIPVGAIATRAARTWLAAHLRHVNPIAHVRYQVELKPVSPELGAIFEPRRSLLVANDTSAAVGYAPLTPTERVVLELEGFLNGPAFKSDFAETGEDVKVMAYRTGRDMALVVAMPFLAARVRSEREYFRLKARAMRAIHRYLDTTAFGRKHAQVVLNALDRPGKGLAGVYLSLLGTSAEQGDSGQVGRGNRVCGVISLNRPMSGEAAAGKNPTSHAGKIYSVLAQELAERIRSRVTGVREATVWLGSTIGQRIDRPTLARVQVALAPGRPLRRLEGAIRAIVGEGLADLSSFCEALARGAHRVY
jgi:S-adenosylmethionine synthetase